MSTKRTSDYQMVRQFTTAMGQPIDQSFIYSNDNQDYSQEDISLIDLRFNLIDEEFEEVRKANTPDNLLKEFADLVYVVLGFCATYGWDFDEAFRRVHLSNMSKLGEDGKPLRREDGKILKGPNYHTPDLSDLVKINLKETL